MPETTFDHRGRTGPDIPVVDLRVVIEKRLRQG